VSRDIKKTIYRWWREATFTRNTSLWIIISASLLLSAGCTSVPAIEDPAGLDTNAVASEQSDTNHLQEAAGEGIEADWARDLPRKRVPIPYDFRETLAWIKNNLFGPSTKYEELTEFIPQSVTLNEITPETTLGFFGDMMQMKGKNLHFSNDLRQFFADADYLIGNFEGTITSTEGVLMASVHTEAVVKSLKRLFPPERTVLTNANNHTCDFGWGEFNKSYQLQREHGFLVIGRKDEPSILLDGHINVANVTQWSNQPCTYLAEFDDIDAAHDPAVFNVLSPHWGYEMQMYPNPAQIEEGKNLLENWDMIIGHHTHAPQVVTAYQTNGTRRLLAYSLGDFCTYLRNAKYRHGIVVRAEIGPDTDGNWKVGRVEWRCSIVDQVDEETTRVRLADGCELFELPESAYR